MFHGIRYQPLDSTKNEIRLLYIRHGSGDTHCTPFQDVEFELKHVSLDAYADKGRQFMADTGSTTYSVKDYAWPDTPGNTLRAEGDGAFRAHEAELDQLVTQPDFGRWVWGDYTTLSYTWGDDADSLPIMVNGCVMEVTANLSSFLRSYATSKRSLSKRMGLWIDAICIDQGNINERNVQVCRMGDIYSRAFGAIVWLGNASVRDASSGDYDDSDKAMDLLSSFELRLLAAPDEWIYHGKQSTPNGHVFPTGSWVALYSLMSRPYWTRLWIIQELALSQDLRIVCGDREVSWARFTSMINTCTHDFNTFMSNLIDDYDGIYGSSDFGDDDDMERWGKTFQRMQELCWLASSSHKSKEVDLTQLLSLSRTSNQSDPRDKVYGMLGLMSGRLSTVVRPNYALSKAEIFKDFTQTAIRVTNSLDVITCQGLPGKERELPSWVPDMTERMCARTNMTTNIPYRASQDSAAIVSFRDNNLIVQGIIVDQIDGRGTRYSHHVLEDENLMHPVYSDNPYEGEVGLRDAIWRTLFANRDSLGNMISESCVRILDTPIIPPGAEGVDIPEENNMFRTGFSWMIHANSVLRIGGRELKSFFWDYMEKRPQTPEWKLKFDPFVRISMLANGRLLISTTKGYFGQARIGVKRGDLVCILLGCSVPVILRRNRDGQSYQFIGESYIHGIMDGEAMDWLKEGKYSLEDICIR